MPKIYRADYAPSDYYINTTKLYFDIKEEYTIVRSKIFFFKNTSSNATSLTLDGEDLELIGLTLDNLTPEYERTDTTLTLLNIPKSFTLEVTTKIYPEQNTKLSGLYKSNAIYCTQCEAHGFRRITYYLDRPDILSTFEVEINTHKNFDALLSNGECIAQHKQYAKWHDPHPKPCYLFALVVGNLSRTMSTFMTKQRKKVELNIWTEYHNQDKTHFAMRSLENAFKWDEERFNLSYDLSVYNLVAVDDFNMGAMENKGLNIFNSAYVLADPETATDDNYLDIEAVIGHEYFHNWTGNRVTCKSWFELSLKEGLTVFRDQEFSSDLRFRATKRINDVAFLRTHQFLEDKSDLAHPVRPEYYEVMDNFYTLTVYEKGSEIVRMLHTMLGEELFQQGFKRYITNYDGMAVEIEDFVTSIVGNYPLDIAKFMLWYSTPGVHQITIEYTDTHITITQADARITPLKFAVFDTSGNKVDSDTLLLKDEVTTLQNNYPKHTFSWNRNFSAPIELTTPHTTEEKLFLLAHDDNDFVRFDCITAIYSDAILRSDYAHVFSALDTLFHRDESHESLTVLLQIPSEKYLFTLVETIDPIHIHTQREKLICAIALRYYDELVRLYNKLHTIEYEFTNPAIIARRLKNMLLEYITKSDNTQATEQYLHASSMTDRLASFEVLLASTERSRVISSFYNTFMGDEQVVNKWFKSIASHPQTSLIEMRALIEHADFNFTTPNKVRSLIGGFTLNYPHFHTQEGYELYTDIILRLSSMNPQIAARLTATFSHYVRFTSPYNAWQQAALERIQSHPDLAKDVREIVDNILKNKA